MGNDFVSTEKSEQGVSSPFLSSRLLDRFEQVGIVALWIWLTFRVIASPNHIAWLALVSETTILIFVLIRRPTESISRNIDDWLLAMLGSFAPALVVVSGNPLPGMEWLAITMVLFGDMFQIWAKLTLRRSFGLAPANRGVKTGGPYKLVRHPMYTGYCIAQLGVLMAVPSMFNLMLFVFCWSIQVVRLKREEKFLVRDSAYQAMMSRIKWRLFPGVY